MGIPCRNRRADLHIENMAPIHSTFAARLNQLREAKGLTQAEAARLIQVPLKTFQAWCQGQRTPPPWSQAWALERLQRLENK